MRHLIRFLLLACFALPSWASVATTTLESGDPKFNEVIQATVNSTENVLQFNINGGSPRTFMLVSDTAWYYRSTTATSTTNLPVAAGQTLTLTINATSTRYFLRQSADGILYILPLYPSRSN